MPYAWSRAGSRRSTSPPNLLTFPKSGIANHFIGNGSAQVRSTPFERSLSKAVIIMAVCLAGKSSACAIAGPIHREALHLRSRGKSARSGTFDSWRQHRRSAGTFTRNRSLPMPMSSDGEVASGRRESLGIARRELVARKCGRRRTSLSGLCGGDGLRCTNRVRIAVVKLHRQANGAPEALRNGTKYAVEGTSRGAAVRDGAPQHQGEGPRTDPEAFCGLGASCGPPVHEILGSTEDKDPPFHSEVQHQR